MPESVCATRETEESYGDECCRRDVPGLLAQQRPRPEGQSDGEHEPEGQREPAREDHHRVIAAAFGVGVVELELLLDGAVVIGRVAFVMSHDRGGERAVDRPRRSGIAPEPGTRVGVSAKPLDCVSISIPWRMGAQRADRCYTATATTKIATAV
jgi:hypothetical protein